MLIERFEQTVKQFPSNTAVQTGNTHCTYSQLNERVNRLAHALLARLEKNKPGETVQAALLFEKGIDMIVSLLAVLKAGMAYVPLDITYPENRITYMLEHSQSRMLVTGQQNLALAETVTKEMEQPIDIVKVEDIPPGLASGNPERRASEDGRAYILYTSGSTGRPKGVVQRHGNVLYYVRNWIRVFEITPQDRLTFLTTFTHDGAMQDIFAALLSGAGLFSFDIKTMLDRQELSAFIRERDITLWHSVPTLYRYFIESFDGNESYPRLRAVILGGEALREHDVELFKTYFPHASMANVYGQTESSVGAICLIDADTAFKKVTLGEPLDETEILLVDDDDEIVEEMGAGEIVVVSNYLAHGYWRDPEETRRKFTNDPELGPMYWTGDLGAYLGSGDIEILGRKDFQVKIRGFRVETGEIETQLLSLARVKEAVVKAWQEESGETYLCAYIVPGEESGEDPGDAVLRDYLLSRLPDYMVPARFVPLEKMPLTASGKIDRGALPEPVEEVQERVFIAPESESEKKLAQIWHDVLFGREQEDKTIGREDNFFRLGGHSLRAMTVISNVHKVFNVKLEIEEIFTYPVLKELAGFIDRAGSDEFQPLQPVERREYYPLSSAQTRLYFLGRMESIGTAYNLPALVALEGELDRERLERMFQRLIERHEIFRTSFFMIDETPVQRIHDRVISRIEDYTGRLRELTGLSAGEDLKGDIFNGPLHMALMDVLNSFIRPFDLAHPPLLRVGLIRVKDLQYVMMIDIHHIISDGTSIAVLVRELMALYQGEPLAAPQLCYTDYTLWQLGRPQQQSLKQQERYWLDVFPGDVPVLDIAADFARPGVQSFEGRRITFILEPEQDRALKEMAADMDITHFMMLLGLYTIFLAKVSGQEDIVVGTPVAGRRHADLQQVMGMFVNTLAIRNRPERDKKLTQFFSEVRDTALKAFSNQEYPFEDLADRVKVSRDAARNPLFDTVFSMQNYDARSIGIPAVEVPGLTLRPVSFDMNVSRFDLLFTAGEMGDNFTFLLEYCTRLFTRETAERFVSQFKQLVRGVLQDRSLTLGELQIISDEEKKKVIEEFNRTETDFPADKTLHALFEDQATGTPDRMAIVGHNEGHVTYGQLNEQSGRLASRLKAEGAGPGAIVALILERSVEMMVSILGILKTGAAYLPIDPGNPEERIDYMLRDSNAALVLKDLGYREQSTLSPLERLNGCRAAAGRVALKRHGRGVSRVGGPAGPGSPAYIIYTSGTTGTPKGALITHANVSRVVKNTNYINITDRDRLLQLSNYAFDGSVFDIYGALLNSAALVLAPGEETAAVDLLAERIRREHITIFFVTAALFNALVEFDIDCLRHVSKVIAGGDRMSVEHARKALDVLGPGRLLNGYGPTETTVFAAVHAVDFIPENAVTIPIGGPISNTSIYILDQKLNPVPIGLRGELYIGGPGVGPGYLNRPELTNQKFLEVQEPFFKKVLGPRRERLYRTGDLARWLPDGTVEFLGRKDQQVKMRGFRIELGEIENQVLKHGAIKEAVVVMRRKEDGDAYLCAYIVHEGAHPGIDTDLRKHLSRSLPDFMVPPFIVSLAGIPLTANGKVDRSALPEPGVDVSLTDSETGGEALPPRNETEEQLRLIWADVLSLEPDKISVAADFFRLGGHSLKAVSLVNAIHNAFRVKIDLSAVFQSPTIEALTELILAKEKPAVTAVDLHIQPQPVKPYYELSYAQRRIWVIQQLNPGSPVFNISTTVFLEDGADEDRVRGVIEALVKRHDSFRTYFKTVGEEVVQVISEEGRVNLETVDLTATPEDEQQDRVGALLEADKRRVFSLDSLPLYRAKLFKLNNRRAVFDFKIHHIIFDGWSLELLQREFLLLLEAAEKGMETEPEPPRIQYKDFVYWQNRLISGEGMSRAKEFWKEQLGGQLPVLSLPYDFTPQPGAGIRSAAYRTVIPQTVLDGLKTIAFGTKSSLFMVLLAGFNMLLAYLSGREDVILAIPGAARQHQDLKHVMGLFVNTLILRGKVEPGMLFQDLLAHTRENTMKVLEYQGYPLELVCDEMNIAYPKLSVFFNKTDIIEAKEELTDLTSRHTESTQDTKFDLTLYLSEYQNGLDIICCYFSHLFEAVTVEKIITLYSRILANIAADPGQIVSKYHKTPQKRKFKRK
jgi:amino acid adenylation domain-containing protein